MPTLDREQALFERMRAVQRPEEERQRLALEERLAAQGRLGTSSAAYGGATPEQLAMATAQEEARGRAMLGAMQQARAEQAQQAALGSQFAGLGATLSGQQRALDAARQQQALQALTAGQGLLGGGLGLQQLQQQIGAGALGTAYLPQAQALNVLQAGMPAAELSQRGQLQGAGLFGQAEMGGTTSIAWFRSWTGRAIWSAWHWIVVWSSCSSSCRRYRHWKHYRRLARAARNWRLSNG